MADSSEKQELKFGKGMKIVDPMPGFQSVPGTSHLFDLAGARVAYPTDEELKLEGAPYQIKGGLLSSISSYFSRK